MKKGVIIIGGIETSVILVRLGVLFSNKNKEILEKVYNAKKEDYRIFLIFEHSIDAVLMNNAIQAILDGKNVIEAEKILSKTMEEYIINECSLI